MNDWAGFFLGILALSAVVQCAFVVAAAISLRNTGARVTDLCRRFDAELKPTLDDLRTGASNLRAISDSGREQAARIEAILSTTLDSIEETVETVQTLVAKPLSNLTDLSAVWSGVWKGVEAYRTSEPRRRSAPVPTRRSEDSDEHMFIG